MIPLRFLLVAALLCATALTAPPARAEDLGERAFRKCQSCHMVGEGAKLRAGPTLNGIFEAPKGGLEKYRYSRVMAEARKAGEIWSLEALDAFLTDPRKTMPGTRMVFAGIRDPEERAALILWLARFDKEGKVEE
ncbi:c-type cytochrome [Neomegalonema sp.]|uniref:c-type cytochrome n=1 Tax=Neomegalonema sp. TaxID=2039713 RepID=UPI0026078C7B|nr:c-type cytochrome [Neomegalonema sp.]MDD2867672.1 c-type cytochrome [Neomegalonema sp.]